MLAPPNAALPFSKGNAEVNTIEHVLAALVGMGIDNCIMELNGPEIPILDGSAEPFVELLDKTGKTEQDAERSYFEIKEPIVYKDKEARE